MIEGVFDKRYAAKLLLFGEYTVLTGSRSLALPFHEFHFSLINNSKDNFNGLIASFYDYLNKCDFSDHNCVFDAENYKASFKGGLYFNSKIPIGSGLGSSGAFTAAVFENFFSCRDIKDLKDLKAVFSLIESYFHGKSSGIDPLIIYLNQGIHTDLNGNISIVNPELSALKKHDLFLVDSGISRSTEKYVTIFKEKILNDEILKIKIKELTQLTNDIIESLLSNDPLFDPFPFFKKISINQFESLYEMIHPSLVKVWESSLPNPDLAFKLCGAGGGGFYYLLSKNNAYITLEKNSFKLLPVHL